MKCDQLTFSAFFLCFKILTDEPICSGNRDAGVEERTSQVLGEGSIERGLTYTLLCVKYIASGNLLYSCREISLVLCGDLDGRVWGSGQGRDGRSKRKWYMFTRR